jgi:threonine/homoserine/homoserine lactone efflux protein
MLISPPSVGLAMDPHTRSFAVAGGGLLSSLAVALYDGFVAGLVAAFGLALGLSAFVVAVDAGVLALSERFARLDSRQRLTLQVGCGSATFGHAVLAVPSSWTLAYDLVLYEYGGWLGLVALGTALTLVGGVWVAVRAVNRRSKRNRG